jgi:hypothetical protein
MNILHSIQKDRFGVKAIYEIELKKHENVYMSVAKTNHMNDERCVVIVDSEKLLELWRREPYGIHSDISMGNIETWKNDRKYLHAEKGFSFGISNPVPLANIVCHKNIESKPVYERRYLFFKKIVRFEERKYDYVAFVNGITRTIWLLAHGAKCFPIECGIKEGAGRLAEVAGYGNNAFTTVEKLTINT